MRTRAHKVRKDEIEEIKKRLTNLEKTRLSKRWVIALALIPIIPIFISVLALIQTQILSQERISADYDIAESSAINQERLTKIKLLSERLQLFRNAVNKCVEIIKTDTYNITAIAKEKGLTISEADNYLTRVIEEELIGDLLYNATAFYIRGDYELAENSLNRISQKYLINIDKCRVVAYAPPLDSMYIYVGLVIILITVLFFILYFHQKESKK